MNNSERGRVSHEDPSVLILADGATISMLGPIVGVRSRSDGLEVRIRIAGHARETVYGYDDKTKVIWTAQLLPFASLSVSDDRRHITLPGGAQIKLDAPMVALTEVRPTLCVISTDRSTGDPRNILAYDSDGIALWKIEKAKSRPDGPYEYAALDMQERLIAFAGNRGFAAEIDPETGTIIDTWSYR